MGRTRLDGRRSRDLDLVTVMRMAAANPEAVGWEVYLNGVRLDRCVYADEEAGEVRELAGVFRGAQVVVTRYGQVELRRKPRT